MRLISIKSLKPGQKMAVPFYTSNGNKFLAEGVEVSDFIIGKFKDMGMEYTYIDDENISDIAYKGTLSVKTVTDLVKAYKTAIDAMASGRNLNEEAIKDACKLIVEDTKTAEIPMTVINASFAIEDPLILHAIRTSKISVAMGMYLGYNFGQLCDLSLAGFIHDFGRSSTITDENPLHAERGFETLRKQRLFSLNSSIVAYQHHENYDGTGFPRGLKGTDISEFSRIVSVADYFDALISGQKVKKMSFEDAYNEIIKNVDQKFDTMMVNAFSRTVQIYNNGTVVLLNNGKKAVIASQNSRTPLRPNIRIISEANSQREDEINLSKYENRELVIKEVLF